MVEQSQKRRGRVTLQSLEAVKIERLESTRPGVVQTTKSGRVRSDTARILGLVNTEDAVEAVKSTDLEAPEVKARQTALSSPAVEARANEASAQRQASVVVANPYKGSVLTTIISLTVGALLILSGVYLSLGPTPSVNELRDFSPTVIGIEDIPEQVEAVVFVEELVVASTPETEAPARRSSPRRPRVDRSGIF